MADDSDFTDIEEIKAELLALKIASAVILDGVLSKVENRDKIIDALASGAMQLAAQVKISDEGVAAELVEQFRHLVGERAASVIRIANTIQRDAQRLQ